MLIAYVYRPIFANMTYLLLKKNVDWLFAGVVSSVGLVIDLTCRCKICKLLQSMTSKGLLP